MLIFDWGKQIQKLDIKMCGFPPLCASILEMLLLCPLYSAPDRECITKVYKIYKNSQVCQ